MPPHLSTEVHLSPRRLNPSQKLASGCQNQWSQSKEAPPAPAGSFVDQCPWLDSWLRSRRLLVSRGLRPGWTATTSHGAASSGRTVSASELSATHPAHAQPTSNSQATTTSATEHPAPGSAFNTRTTGTFNLLTPYTQTNRHAQTPSQMQHKLIGSIFPYSEIKS